MSHEDNFNGPQAFKQVVLIYNIISSVLKKTFKAFFKFFLNSESYENFSYGLLGLITALKTFDYNKSIRQDYLILV